MVCHAERSCIVNDPIDEGPRDEGPIDEDREEAAPLVLALDAWHRAKGARMVDFAGYQMPVQYEGIMAEHLWVREHAGLFDVSHMGQLVISGEGAAQALEALVPGDIATLKPGRVRYTLLLDERGGVLDDLMVTNVSMDEPAYYCVVNGAMKWDDIAHLREHLPDAITLNHLDDRALLALQGPEAATVLDRLMPGISGELKFMQASSRSWQGAQVGIGRTGYTGEDGFELSIPAEAAQALADALVEMAEVKPIGLGARDSLRLEAGLPLYGHDVTARTDPVTAGLAFTIAKARRAPGGFPGAAHILPLLEQGPARRRVGLSIEGRMAAREGARVFAGDQEVGEVTSGGFSPSLQAPIAMAYVDAAHAAEGTALSVEMRGRQLAARVAPLPFVPHRYHR